MASDTAALLTSAISALEKEVVLATVNGDAAEAQLNLRLAKLKLRLVRGAGRWLFNFPGARKGCSAARCTR